MKKYMGYCDEIGASEGAVLVFANNEEEAKEQTLKSDIMDFFEEGDEPTVRELINEDYLDQYKKSDEPHSLTPPVCESCEMWGNTELDENGLCEDCQECEHENTEPGDCSSCCGTGEGANPDVSCSSCGGSGVFGRVCSDCGEEV